MKFYIKLYWTLWISLIFLALACKLIFFRHSEDCFFLFWLYLIPTWVSVIVLNVWEGRRLMEYLRLNHNSKWIELTTVLGIPGGRNSFRTIPFLYSKDNLNDPMVEVLKRNYRMFMLFILTVFLTFPLILLFCALL